jgi:hypothetical protein
MKAAKRINDMPFEKQKKGFRFPQEPAAVARQGDPLAVRGGNGENCHGKRPGLSWLPLVNDSCGMTLPGATAMPSAADQTCSNIENEESVPPRSSLRKCGVASGTEAKP